MGTRRTAKANDEDAIVEVRIPMKFAPKGSAKRIIIPDGAESPARQPQPNNALIKALARGFRWRRMLEAGDYGTLADLAAAEKINPSYVSRVLRLTLLSPDLIEAILNAEEPQSLTPVNAMRPFPLEWHALRRKFNSPDPDEHGQVESEPRHLISGRVCFGPKMQRAANYFACRIPSRSRSA